ncbi:MAG TPA: hypothetical protein PKY59_20110 [Pyrinomonadaceae bacterium]|nr:hypothetical protein [Pyrinomonadaceae bacterium]
MTIKKVIPRYEEGMDLLAQNLNSKLPALKTTLNISDDMLETLSKNAAAYHGWRLLKDQLSNTKIAVTSFVDNLFRGDKKDPVPTKPDLTFVAPQLPQKPGIETQIKELIEYIELQDAFTDAIGLDLGFYVEEGDSASPETLVGNFKTEDLSGYRLKIIFSLQKQDAFRLGYRIKGAGGGAWTFLTLTKSPYILEITPDPNGLAVTVEMQGTLVKNNETVGHSSDPKTVVAKP